MPRPAVVAFDIIQTTFSLEALRPRLTAAGLPADSLESWFAGTLRDAFALDVTGVFKPFKAVARAGLTGLLAAAGRESAAADRIIEGFGALDPHPDAAPAMRALREGGIRIVALTNGSASVTRRLLERGGLTDFVERTVSIDDVGRWKPAREVYLHCAKAMETPPPRVALVAAHGWDIHGAARAGLMTGYVGRSAPPFPDVMDPPDVSASSLLDLANAFIERRD
ncbi:MAG: haloacid dehalogenase type II [Pararhizobium sp.]